MSSSPGWLRIDFERHVQFCLLPFSFMKNTLQCHLALFPLSSTWLNFHKNRTHLHLASVCFLCYISESKHPWWHHRQPPSKNKLIFQRQSGFSFNCSFLHHLLSHNSKLWGHTVQEPSWLHWASAIRPLAFSFHLHAHSSPLCGTVAQSPGLPLHPQTHLTFVSQR